MGKIKMLIVYGREKSPALEAYLQYVYPAYLQIRYGRMPEELGDVESALILYEGEAGPVAGAVTSLCQSGIPAEIRKFPETISEAAALSIAKAEKAGETALRGIRNDAGVHKGVLLTDTFLKFLDGYLGEFLSLEDACAKVMSHPEIRKMTSKYDSEAREKAMEWIIRNDLLQGNVFTRQECLAEARKFSSWMGRHRVFPHPGNDADSPFMLTFRDGSFATARIGALIADRPEAREMAYSILYMVSSQIQMDVSPDREEDVKAWCLEAFRVVQAALSEYSKGKREN